MIPIFKCEVCDRTYNDVETASKCEKEHTIIRPKLWWLIPFVGMFIIPYHLFTKRKAIVIFGNRNGTFLESLKADLWAIGIGFVPIVLVLCWILITATIK